MENIRNIIGLMLCVGTLNTSMSTAWAASTESERGSTSTAQTSITTDKNSDPLMAEFSQQARTYEKLFKEGNSDALSDQWTSDGVLETFDGQVIRGKGELKAYFARDFSQFGSQSLKINIVSVRTVAPEVVVEKGTVAVASQAPSSKYIALHVKKDGAWKMSWVQETAFQDRDIDSIQAFSWLSGKWKAGSKTGDTVEIQAKFIENGSFLECTTFDTELKTEVRQIIGYSPLLGTLVSWHFTPNGGFGRGEWSRLPDGWRQQSVGVLPDGLRTFATYTIKQKSKDVFTWQSTQRSVNGVSVPDSAILVLNRVSE